MIDRHFTEDEEIISDEIDYYMGRLDKICTAIKKRPASSLGSAFRKSFDILSLLIVGSRERSKILRIFKFAKNLGLINFQFGTKVDENFTCVLEESVFMLVGQQNTVYMDIDTWLNAWFCSVLLRDMEAIKSLCQVPESIHKKANIKPDPFDLCFVKAIKGLFNPNADIVQLLIEAIEASDSNLIHPDRLGYSNYILLPQLHLYRCILTSNQEEFNDGLREALLSHQVFWQEEDKKYDSKGWISLPLMAAAAIAYDTKDYELAFETDYIPSWLARGDFH